MKLALAAAVVVLVALIPIGRWERSRHGDDENAGIERVYRAVGRLDAPSFAGFRFLESFQCAIYRRGTNEFALELCVDWDGRVVEAIDRRGGEVRISSLREDPERARVRVDRRAFEQLLEGRGECTTCKEIFKRARAEGGQARS